MESSFETKTNLYFKENIRFKVYSATNEFAIKLFYNHKIF